MGIVAKPADERNAAVGRSALSAGAQSERPVQKADVGFL